MYLIRYYYALDCEDFLFNFVCSSCACCQFFGVWFVMLGWCGWNWLKPCKIFCKFWFANHPSVMNLWDSSTPRIHPPKVRSPGENLEQKFELSKISTNQIRSPWQISMVVSFQALQQCLCFWPGEAMLLKALAQSSLRLGDFPRWGKTMMKMEGWGGSQKWRYHDQAIDLGVSKNRGGPAQWTVYKGKPF